MRRVLLSAVAVMWTLPAHGQQSDDDRTRAPRVQTVTPATGAEGVAPGSAEIHVRFDMPMSREGYSFVGSGPHFPQPTGAARWIDAYECVLPVKLKPSWVYRFGINSPRHKNFRSVWLVPVVPVACQFETAGVSAVKHTPDEQRRLNITSYDALCEAMRTRYSYLERLGLDWEAVFAAHRKEVVDAPDVQEWTRRAARMLSSAEDLHLLLELDGDKHATAVRSVTPNWNRASTNEAFPDMRDLGSGVAVARASDGIGYVLIGTWSNDAGAAVERLHTVFAEMVDAPGIVIDVRPNAGGSETLARKVAAWFVDKPRVYARHAFRRGPNSDDFTPERERTVKPNDADRRYRGPVVVLMGRANMSSCEAFLLMMKQAPNATLVGETSYGSSGNPKPAFLPNGVIAHIPSWKAMLPDGSTFEGRGIPPDVEIPSKGVDFAKRDPVLDAGLRLLRERAANKER